MSNENEVEKEGKSGSTGGGIAGVIEFFKNNPKALYGVGGALVVVVLAMMMSGGDGEIAQVKTSAVTVGQTVVVRNPNIGDTWLTASPRMGFEETGEEKEQFICLVKSGATGTVEEETVVTYIPYAKVTVKDGECAGKTGWTPKVNVSVK
ncbi:MAG: hypothetical protein H6R26_3400 [Proteobacteria bacterium]|nr:hypothetical protein [Pseudomonadota bacterium]